MALAEENVNDKDRSVRQYVDDKDHNVRQYVDDKDRNVRQYVEEVVKDKVGELQEDLCREIAMGHNQLLFNMNENMNWNNDRQLNRMERLLRGNQVDGRQNAAATVYERRANGEKNKMKTGTTAANGEKKKTCTPATNGKKKKTDTTAPKTFGSFC
jgi:hypothetical protein